MRKDYSNIVKIKETKIDGQFCRIFLWKEGVEMNLTFYNVGFIVAPNKKMARQWKKEFFHCRQTGKSLRPLIWALEQIRGFVEGLKSNEFIAISGSDERRVSAYRYLTKIGAIPLEDSNGLRYCINKKMYRERRRQQD